MDVSAFIVMKVCANPDCGRQFTEEQSSGKFCFPCKINSVNFNWVGGGSSYGRKNFSERTNTEVANEIKAVAAREGTEIRPVGARWV